MPEVLERATVEMTPDDFARLLKLSVERQWLLGRSKAVFDLWKSCDTQEKRDLVVELLYRFKVISFQELDLLCSDIKDHMQGSWALGSGLITTT